MSGFDNGHDLNVKSLHDAMAECSCGGNEFRDRILRLEAIFSDAHPDYFEDYVKWLRERIFRMDGAGGIGSSDNHSSVVLQGGEKLKFGF